MECVDVIKSEKNNGSHSADTKGWVLGKYALDLFIDLDFGFTYLSQNIRSSSIQFVSSFFCFQIVIFHCVENQFQYVSETESQTMFEWTRTEKR